MRSSGMLCSTLARRKAASHGAPPTGQYKREWWRKMTAVSLREASASVSGATKSASVAKQFVLYSTTMRSKRVRLTWFLSRHSDA